MIIMALFGEHMKPWMWYALGAAGLLFLMAPKNLYVSRAGIAGVMTPDFASDTATSTTVRAKPVNVDVLSSDVLFPESSGWRI